MNKTIEYEGYSIDINIQLNSSIEKRINGNRYHLVKLKIVGEDFSIIAEVNDKVLVEKILEYEDKAKHYIDNKEKPAEVRLTNLGFKSTESKKKTEIFNCSCGEGSKVIGENYCSQCLKENPLLCS